MDRELLYTNYSGVAKVSVYDTQGKLVRSQSAKVSAGANALPVEKKNLSPGIYFLRVTLGASDVSLSKFVIQR